MLNHTTWKKIMTGALAFTLVSGVAVPVLTTATPIVQAAEAGITPFTDIPAGLYAEKHIYRLSLQQIVRGYENKATGEFTFKYNNTISQEEAIIMALRFAGMESSIDKDQLIIFPENFYVKEDYKPYIELAFETGILEREEEYSIAAAEPDKKWGSKAASREWVTKLIVNTLGAPEKAREYANQRTSFTDHNEIDSKYVGYVNAAVELGLIKGYTETTFAPKAPINRASFATILSRAQKDYPLHVDGQHYGVITELSDTSISIYEDGKEKTFTIDKSTGYYESNSDFAIDKSLIEPYTTVAVIEVNGQAKFIESLDKTKRIEEKTASVLLVNKDDKIIYIRENNKPVPVPLNENVKIVDSAGKVLEFNDLQENSNIKIITDTFRPSSQIISLEVINEEVPATTTIEGTFFSYDKSKSLITVKTDKGLISKIVVKTPIINIPYVKNASIDNLVANGDVVRLTMNDKDEVIEVSVPSEKFKALFLPEIVNYDAKKDQITVLDASGLKAETLFITDSTRYLLDGVLVDSKFIKEPLKAPSILLRYVEVDGKKQIVYFDIISQVEAKIVSMDYFEEIAEVELPDGTITELDYTKATLESLSKEKPNYLDLVEGTNVVIELSNNERLISSFKFQEMHIMTVSSINSITQAVTLKNGDKSYTVLYDEAEFVDSTGKQLLFSELKTNQSLIVNFYGKRITRAILQ